MIIKICKVLIVPMYHYTSANCAELQKNCKPNYRDDNFKALRTIFRVEIHSCSWICKSQSRHWHFLVLFDSCLFKISFHHKIRGWVCLIDKITNRSPITLLKRNLWKYCCCRYRLRQSGFIYSNSWHSGIFLFIWPPWTR